MKWLGNIHQPRWTTMALLGVFILTLVVYFAVRPEPVASSGRIVIPLSDLPTRTPSPAAPSPTPTPTPTPTPSSTPTVHATPTPTKAPGQLGTTPTPSVSPSTSANPAPAPSAGETPSTPEASGSGSPASPAVGSAPPNVLPAYSTPAGG